METKHIHHMYALKLGISLSGEKKKNHCQFININSQDLGVLRIPSYNINAKLFSNHSLKIFAQKQFQES